MPPIVTVPEPATLALYGIALLAIILYRGMKSKKHG
ncbi:MULTISPECIES: PEP-CTERM sorting domain-containing protein [unclassified Hahella]|nr:PEP-CTERM sorting domain-containing protein [Hahella sp. KA22]MBU6952638.1 PEP-CTERM sorting domain-containing protein [Hahella sp. HN01]QAY58119.1 PEP-CTERM sorting domain-containing protein [Hahella sp. KA22]